MLPVVTLEGSPREQGLMHGRALREAIAHNHALYADRFAREGRLSTAEVEDRSRRYWEAIRTRHADYAAGVAGIAEGADRPLQDIVALNVRYEILYHQFAANAGADGCTAFAALPAATATGTVLMGQNWDWIPDVRGAIVRVREPGRTWAAFTEAGILGGKIGLNDAGLGLAINGLTSMADDWARLATPFHVRCYEILRAGSVDEAVAVVDEAPRSCSANFLIAHRDGWARSIESAPAGTCALAPEDGAIAHANHFLAGDEIGLQEPPNPRRAGSLNRLAQMRRLLATGRPLDADRLMAHLRDHTGHPDSVCRHIDPHYPPEQHYETVASVVMDLGAGTMWAAPGPPCASEYRMLALAEP